MGAAELGIPPDVFQAADYSLDELEILTEGASRRWSALYELGLFVAWHVAAFSRMKRIPSWSSVRPSKVAARHMTPMTEAEMIAAMMAHTAYIQARESAPNRIVLRKVDP